HASPAPKRDSIQISKNNELGGRRTKKGGGAFT
uniref:Uncharacterized protein n=1 Tax=Aegilops tauschii subsp. strangulata TaxID=200361 RepID=A0A452Y6M8_AEGTS